MGSEAPPAVTIHVTGFKKFHGVPENPTETIVNNLKDYLKKKGSPKGLTLGSSSILETAGQGVLDALNKTLQSSFSTKGSESLSPGRVIWVSCSLVLSSLCICCIHSLSECRIFPCFSNCFKGKA